MAIPWSHNSGWFCSPCPGGVVEPMLKQGVWMLAAIPALVAGWTDWRSRRIPNWLTVPALLLGIGVNSLAAGWSGSQRSRCWARDWGWDCCCRSF